MTHESDETGEPYALQRDTEVHKIAKKEGVQVMSFDIPQGHHNSLIDRRSSDTPPSTYKYYYTHRNVGGHWSGTGNVN